MSDRDVVAGRPVDEQTRCVHWNSPLDVVAIEFACCRRLFPCRECHDETADHPAATWPAGSDGVAAVLCGVCRTRMTIGAYLACGDRCPTCGAGFNPGCRLHHHRYFDATAGAGHTEGRASPNGTSPASPAPPTTTSATPATVARTGS